MEYEKIKQLMEDMGNSKLTAIDIDFPDGTKISMKKENKQENVIADNQISYKISNIPEYSGDIYVLINNNEPKFFEYDMQIDECYSNLENGRVRNGYDKN